MSRHVLRCTPFVLVGALVATAFAACGGAATDSGQDSGTDATGRTSEADSSAGADVATDDATVAYTPDVTTSDATGATADATVDADGAAPAFDASDAAAADDARTDAAPASDAQADVDCPADRSSITSYAPIAAPLLSALADSSDAPTWDAGGSPPAGWQFHRIADATCRDGSPMGIYVRRGAVSKLMVYFEGDGLCFSSHFCDHTPANITQTFSPDPQTEGQTIARMVGYLVSPPYLQQPSASGIFDQTKNDNPFKDWNQVYVPYCTGDAHFGTIGNGAVTDYRDGQPSAGTQSVNPGYKFVGFSNTQKIMGHLATTFTSPDKIVLTGSGAGGLGAIFNAPMTAATFGGIVATDVLVDSAGLFSDTKYLSACLQQEFRSTFGWDAALPSDCAECRHADGSGLMNVVAYFHHRYPQNHVGMISTIHDQVVRWYYGAGQGSTETSPQDCDSNDPNVLVNLGSGSIDVPRYPAALLTEGLQSFRTRYDCTSRFSSYFIGSTDAASSESNVNTVDTLHMHVFRDRFYAQLVSGVTPAQWASAFVAGNMADVGP